MSISPLRLSRGLYAITPDDADTRRLLLRVEPVLAAGVACLQYRNKAADAPLRAAQGHALAALCRRFGVALIINDDVALAHAVGAGVHLGGDDGDLAAARASLGPDALIGASCYDSMERAERAAAAGASYVAFGAFFPSSTKPQARRADADLLRRSAVLGLPRVAIGGITPDNGGALVAAGADLLAVIGALFDAPDPAGVARRFSALFQDSTQ
jgi:thiamine-phosphate pyrophosphorylase